MHVNGVRIHLSTEGHGPACLLLHGYPETSYTWRHVIPALAPHYTVHAPDFRGWGDSEATGPYSLDGMVDDTLALMDALGHERYTVVGHDWGAATAYRMALLHPERFDRLVTINMPLKRFNKVRPLHFYFFLMPLLPEIIMGLFGDAFVRLILRWWTHNQAALPEEVIRHYQAAARQPGANQATRAYYRNTMWEMALPRGKKQGLGPHAHPHRITVPWHVLWGANDPVSPMENVRYFQEDMPGIPVTLIDEAGHFPQEEQPDAFNRHLLSFLLHR